MRRYLLRRFSSETAASTTERLQEQGLLDDYAFARAWVQSRLSHKPRSAALIARELGQRGVSREAIESALDDADDKAAAHQAVRRFLRRPEGSDPWEFRRKGWQFLQRRGFSSSVIRHTLQRLEETLEEPPREDMPDRTP